MAFLDALKDTVTIYRISIAFDTGDTVGEQVKAEAALYSSVPGRLHTGSANFRRGNIDNQEDFKYSWTLLMKPEHNGANRGDKAVVNGQNYIIVGKQEIRGISATANHVVYYLQEGK